MVEQYVSANSLSCLLNRNCFVELIPEPFRMQYSVSFRVAYSEYINYILSLKEDSGVKLTSDFQYLKNLVSVNHPRLYSCFLQDIAFAICKELHFAEKYNKDASVIIPTSFRNTAMKVTDCLKSYSACREVEGEMIEQVTSTGYSLKSVKRPANIPLFQLAVILYQLSKATTEVKEVSLVYDLR